MASDLVYDYFEKRLFMSLYTLRTGATSHPEDSVLMLADIIEEGGVRTVSTVTNELKVSEKSGTPDMSVDVAAGKAFIYESPGNVYPCRSTATENKTVTANASGNPRVDSVVAYIDLSATPDATASNVFKLAVVAGTPAGSPTAPDDTAIGTAIGASNPYLILADIAVSNGATSIVNANITDKRKRYKARNENKVYSLTYSSGLTPHFPNGATQYVPSVTGSLAFSEPTGMRAGDMLNLIWKQDGAGGRAVTFGFTITWFGGTPTFTTVADKEYSIILEKKSDTTGGYWGYVIGQEG